MLLRGFISALYTTPGTNAGSTGLATPLGLFHVDSVNARGLKLQVAHGSRVCQGKNRQHRNGPLIRSLRFATARLIYPRNSAVIVKSGVLAFLFPRMLGSLLLDSEIWLRSCAPEHLLLW